MQETIASRLEIVTIVMLSVFIMNAIEIAVRKIPMYKLALLLRNSLNSLMMVFEYLANKVNINTKAKKMTKNM